MEFIAGISAAFLTLFITIDPLGVLPFYISFVDHLEKQERKKILREAIITVFSVGVVFVFAGRAVLHFLGVTLSDFRIAGGIILLVLAIIDLFFGDKERRKPQEGIGVVPIGIPLILGPAALTSLLLLVPEHGKIESFVAFIGIIGLVWIVFNFYKPIIKMLGNGFLKVFSKIMTLLLATFAVMMIRVGIIEAIIEMGK